MYHGFLGHREQLLRIEMACERVRDLLERARRLELNRQPALAEAARERAAEVLENLERPHPTSPHPCASVRRAAA
jgi:hypothetical protein